MAGDWIKMRGNLWDDPRIAALCDTTGASEATVIGGLYWLWATADQHSEDGIMPGLTLRGIDRKTGIQGLGVALVGINWLADHPEGVRLVRFEEHNGESAKRRCVDAKRKANLRTLSTGEPDKLPTDCGQDTPPLGAREREEEELKAKTVVAALPPDIDPQVAADFKALRNKQKAPITATVIKGIQREASKAGISLQDALAMCCERSWRGFKADWVKEAPGKVNGSQGPPWWASDAGVIAKGSELGLTAKPGESIYDFKGRIQQRMGQ